MPKLSRNIIVLICAVLVAGCAGIPVAKKDVKDAHGSPPYPNGGPPPKCDPDPVSGNGPEPGPKLPNSPRSLAVDYKNVYNSTKYGFSDLLTESVFDSRNDTGGES